MKTKFEIIETTEYGVILIIKDADLADEFDDFINKECYAFTELKLETSCVYFYFGQASCKEKVKYLTEIFMKKQ